MRGFDQAVKQSVVLRMTPTVHLRLGADGGNGYTQRRMRSTFSKRTKARAGVLAPLPTPRLAQSEPVNNFETAATNQLSNIGGR
jgi:hypothetical protein